jgi:hypothetical protein
LTRLSTQARVRQTQVAEMLNYVATPSMPTVADLLLDPND